MKDQDKEEIRKAWLEADFLNGVPYDAKAIKNAIADYWLTILDQSLNARVELARKEIEGSEIDYANPQTIAALAIQGEDSEIWAKGWDAAVKEILDLPSLQITTTKE